MSTKTTAAGRTKVMPREASREGAANLVKPTMAKEYQSFQPCREARLHLGAGRFARWERAVRRATTIFQKEGANCVVGAGVCSFGRGVFLVHMEGATLGELEHNDRSSSK